jgi:hypothetical protein
MTPSYEALTAVISAALDRPRAETPADRLCHAARKVLGVGGASLSLRPPTSGPRVLLSATDATASDLEDVEDVLGTGPAHLAARGESVRIDPAHAEAPWANVAAEMLWPRDLPWVAAVPLGNDGALGALLVYTDDPGTVTPLSRVDDVGLALSSILTMRSPEAWIEQGVSHAATNQAIGMLMATHRIDADTALALLRSRAISRGARLHETAGDVISAGGSE